MRQNGSFIEYETTFANKPCFPHGILGVFVSGDARIGRNCVIFQHVLIGSNYLPGSSRRGAPVIGDNCFIGAGARIIGGIRVGDGCRVGAGCVISDDIPDNSVVVGVAPRIITRSKPMMNKYYMQRKDGWYYYFDETWMKETDPAVVSSLVARPEAGSSVLKDLETNTSSAVP
jgi:serine O-acetyltransferase